MFRISIASVILVITLTAKASAGVIVNEVLSNEPGSDVGLEWVELYNDSTDDALLSFFFLSIGADSIGMAPLGLINAKSYAVIARNASQFEMIWGDGSGVWGDEASEDYPLMEGTFKLLNVSGQVVLKSAFGDSSVLTWTSSGADGVSWERYTPATDSIAQSSSSEGSTPGRMNAITPDALNWSLGIVTFRKVSKEITRIEIIIVNSGLAALPGACVAVLLNPQLDNDQTALSGDTLACVEILPLDSGRSGTVFLELILPNIYETVGIQIVGSDDRPGDNFKIVQAPGAKFPPIALTEFLADPISPTPEWIEIKNISDTTIDIGQWMVGDSVDVKDIDLFGYLIMPGEYVVLTKSESAFLESYPQAMVSTIEVGGWRTLNNSGDIVRLIDHLGILADSFSYATVYGSNITWSRSEEPGRQDLWGRSESPGGTPGATNVTLLSPSGNGLEVTISPDPFSPDGDMFEDTAYIEFVSTPGDNFEITIFDTQGNEIRTLFDGAPFDGRVGWDGKDNSGKRAPIGIYIVLLKIEGVASAKKTVVVAR
ncbi:MAG: lamin tail domain-containing protein [candidate division Zixibacteria bacterium]|nr:lamin tail domain-containing protein [candidate division Zixibacteria bacterium]